MPEQTDNAQAQTTPDAAANNTGAGEKTGAATQTAQTEETQADITQSPEFKNALTKAIEKKLPQLRKQLAKEISGEPEGDKPDVEELQRQLTDFQNRTRAYETREAVSQFISDPKNKIAARAENMRAIEKLVLSEIEYDDDGKPANLKEAVERVKSEAPTLFQAATGSINGGNRGTTNAVDFNEQLRQAAGYIPR